MMNYQLIYTVVVSAAFLSLIRQRTQLLMSLLSLEAMILGLVTMTLSLSTINSFEPFIILILLTLGACEATLGLALLVTITRTHGSDHVKTLTSHKL